jgi:hypothetical protein
LVALDITIYLLQAIEHGGWQLKWRKRVLAAARMLKHNMGIAFKPWRSA